MVADIAINGGVARMTQEYSMRKEGQEASCSRFWEEQDLTGQAKGNSPSPSNLILEDNATTCCIIKCS